MNKLRTQLGYNQGFTQLDPSADSRLVYVASEYHAFISFIQKARANRKGAWDSRWTAEAFNNYIREGFGRPPLAGPYTTYSPQPK